MPAAAVIPAPQVYIYFAEFKKLVVGSACSASGAVSGRYWNATHRMPVCRRCSSSGVGGGWRVYFEQIRVLNAGVSLVYFCME